MKKNHLTPFKCHHKMQTDQSFIWLSGEIHWMYMLEKGKGTGKSTWCSGSSFILISSIVIFNPKLLWTSRISSATIRTSAATSHCISSVLQHSRLYKQLASRRSRNRLAQRHYTSCHMLSLWEAGSTNSESEMFSSRSVSWRPLHLLLAAIEIRASGREMESGHMMDRGWFTRQQGRQSPQQQQSHRHTRHRSAQHNTCCSQPTLHASLFLF